MVATGKARRFEILQVLRPLDSPIQLKEKSIQVGQDEIALSPGMAVRAEVKTDKRKVIDYFLSPLKEYTDQSLNER